MENQLKDIILFAKFTFHLSCLEPISEELTKLGIENSLITQRHVVYDSFNERKKKFKVIVIADEYFNLFRDCAEVMVGTGHSLVSKNTTFSSRNNDADYLCVASNWQKNEFINRGIYPRKEFWITGYPAADNLFKKNISNYNNFIFFPTNGKKNILIAPTHNRDLNLMDSFIRSEQVVSELVNKFNLTFKPHPVLPKKYPDQIEFMKHLSSKYENVNYVEDSHSNISDYILLSDVFLGDCSGAMILALAGNKPIIAYNNPNRFSSPYYDKSGLEWTMRKDFAHEIEDISELLAPLEYGIFYPKDISDLLTYERTKVRNLIFGDFQDGESSRRIAEKIRRIIT